MHSARDHEREPKTGRARVRCMSVQAYLHIQRAGLGRQIALEVVEAR